MGFFNTHEFANTPNFPASFKVSICVVTKSIAKQLISWHSMLSSLAVLTASINDSPLGKASPVRPLVVQLNHTLSVYCFAMLAACIPSLIELIVSQIIKSTWFSMIEPIEE